MSTSNGTAQEELTPVLQQAPKAVLSPAGSVSSILSSESTKKLINSLTSSELNSHIQVLPVLPKTELPPVAPKPVESKKPIKFTVRRVSHENTIPVPGKKASTPHSYKYGNLPENRTGAQDRRAADKESQLSRNQAKYDAYESRIDKIDKEIRFLENLLPPYNVEIDYSTRTKITRAIEKLRMKKDEIEKKKYSLGIAISRLWRDHDENNTWVRSVSKQ